MSAPPPPLTPPVARSGLSAAGSVPVIDVAAAFVAVSAGVYRLEAALTFATVPALRRPGIERIGAAPAEVEFDLQRVTGVDSAGLALLIDWLAEARVRQRTLRYAQAPDALRALARLSDVESLIAPPSAVSPSPAVSASPAAARSP